jgi:hypothetical protein
MFGQKYLSVSVFTLISSAIFRSQIIFFHHCSHSFHIAISPWSCWMAVSFTVCTVTVNALFSNLTKNWMLILCYSNLSLIFLVNKQNTVPVLFSTINRLNKNRKTEGNID